MLGKLNGSTRSGIALTILFCRYLQSKTYFLSLIMYVCIIKGHQSPFILTLSMAKKKALK